MPVYVKEDYIALFVHIPKTGGSSINDLFLKSGWERFFYSKNIDSNQRRLRRVYKVTPQHWESSTLQKLFKINRFDAVFCVSRHPISRFKSEFAYRNRNLDPNRLNKHFVTKWLLSNLVLYFKNRNHKDNHLRPQKHFLLRGMKIYKIESGFQQIVKEVNSDFGFDLNVLQELRRKDSSKYQIRSIDVPISAFTRLILWTFYFQDFTRFKYSLFEPKTHHTKS